MSEITASTAPSVTRSAKPPGPPGHWLWGNMAAFRSNRLAFMREAAREYGGVVGLRFATRQIWLVTEPAVIETVLVTRARQFQKHFVLRATPVLLGNGLLTSEGDFWLRQRRLSQPAFLRPQISSYVPTFAEYTSRMLDRWQPGSRHDIVTEMMALTLGITSRTLFGAEGNDYAERVRNAMRVAQEEFLKRISRMIPIPRWFPTKGNRRLWKTARDLDEIIFDFIHQRRSSPQEGDDLLSRLLHARDESDQTGMSDKQLRDELLTIFLAGQETTALALSWTWYLLSQHPDEAQKLAAEVEDVLGDRAPTAEDVSRLKCVERALLESMRLYPPAYLVGREALVDMDLAGYRCAKGTTVLMPQAVVHRDPRYFADPDKFVPDRWQGDFEKQLPRCAYFPFGAGPRICIGNTFAMVEMVVVLAMIAQRFRFTIEPGQTITPGLQFTLRPNPGIMATVTQR